MFDKLIFYNHWHVGDLFQSREFVKEITKIIPAKKYLYAHKNNKRIFIDIKEIKNTVLLEQMEIYKDIIKEENNLYINTWNRGKYFCSIDSYYKMYNEFLRRLGFPEFTQEPEYFIPDIDETKLNIESINLFIKEHPEEKILICNGKTLSGQALNFDFTPILKILSDNFPKKTFIVTQKLPISLPNVFDTDSIIKAKDGFDINEIVYLSMFCTILAGRYSGPHTCVQTKRNLFDPTKTVITFTYERDRNMSINSNKIKAQNIWSSEQSTLGVSNIISNYIGK